MSFGDDDGDQGLDLENQVGTDGAGSDAGESNAAPASEAAGETKDEGLLSVIRDAVDPSKKPEAAAASPAEGEEGEGDKPDPNAPKKEDDEDYSDVPFNKHPRFRKLLAERNGFKADAGEYQKVQTFLKSEGLSAQEAGDLLVTGALAKRDPAKAWQMVLPWVQNLAKAAGEVLSPELEQMVRDGAMTQEAAFEVSRARAGVAASTATRSFEQQRAEQTQQEQAAADLRNSAVTWEQERRERDPNFDAKVEPILKELAWRRSQGEIAQTPEEARKQLNDIYKVVNAAMTPPATPAPRPAAPPARRELKPVTGGSVAGNARPAPKTMLEVVQQASGG